MDDGYHPPVEEYLETVHSLIEEGFPPIQARIADQKSRLAPKPKRASQRMSAKPSASQIRRTNKLRSVVPF